MSIKSGEPFSSFATAIRSVPAGSPDEDGCTRALAWSINTGEIDGVDVARLNVVSVSFHSGHRETGGQEDDQYERLVEVFNGEAGGPLGELRTLIDVLQKTQRGAITITFQANTRASPSTTGSPAMRAC